MKARLTTCIVVLLLMCVVLGGLSFRGMLACIHLTGDHEQKTVHFHYGGLCQPPGQTCDESPTGICHTTDGDVGWHFPLTMEALRNARPFFKCTLAFNPGLHFHIPELADGSLTDTHWIDRFQQPSFLFLDTAFTKSTILII